MVDFIEFIKQKKSFKGTPLSAQSVVHRYSALRQLFNYCIGLNIYKGISPLNMRTKNALPKVDNKIINYLSEEEIRNFLGVLESYRDKNLANLFKFAFFTGMRLNEILSLEWQHFDSSKSILKITASKSGKIENIALSKQALHILEEQRHLIPSDVKYVFPNDEYKRRANVRTQFIKLKEQAGINRPFRFHDLRHNYASMLIESGVDLYTVQHLLTHKDPKTTQRYAHLKPDNMINAADKVGKLVEKLKKN